jgi:hypothetical protein
MTFDPDNLEIWREVEDLPRLELIGRGISAATVELEVFTGEPPDDVYRFVYFRLPAVCPNPLFACVVGPTQDLTAAMERWVAYIFPGVPIPRFEIVSRS